MRISSCLAILTLLLLGAGLRAEDSYELRRFPSKAALTKDQAEALLAELAKAARAPNAEEEAAIVKIVKADDYKPLCFLTRNRATILAVIRFSPGELVLHGDDYRLIASERFEAIVGPRLK